MKKQLLLVLTLAFISCSSFAQTLKDMSAAESMTWYGIDFTAARFQNFGAYMSDKAVKTGLPRWSMHPFGNDDLDKFRKKFKKSEIKVEDKVTATHNKENDYTTQMTTEAYEMTMDDLKQVVSGYEISGEGYGLMFIVESFEYKAKKSNVWAVYINKTDKSVIDAKKVTTETYGDWYEGMLNTVQQGAKYLKSAR